MKRLLGSIVLVALIVPVAGCDTRAPANQPADDDTYGPDRSVLLVRIEGSMQAFPNESVDLTAVATGGAGEYTFAWTMAPISVGALSATTGATVVFESNNVGHAEITVVVTDALSQTNTDDVTIQVLVPE